MTETGAAPRAKHTAEEIKRNHLNAAERSLLAAHKRVAKVDATREDVKARAATIDSEHASATALYNGAKERYRHAHLIATGQEPESYPVPEGLAPLAGDGLTMEPEQTEDEDVTEDGADDF